MITAKNITKTYINGEITTEVLRGIDLDIKKGEFVAIMGKSGAGKSTLLYQISLLDNPTGGEITVGGIDILALSQKKRTRMRLQKLGYIFQDYALVPELTAIENVAIPLLMQDIHRAKAMEQAKQVIDQIGLEGKYDNRPNQLSGGQQQRVSIARAIVSEPEILFADEPTANLDSVSSRQVIAALKDLHDKGQTIVMVTHEPEYAAVCDRVIYMEDGLVVSQDYQL